MYGKEFKIRSKECKGESKECKSNSVGKWVTFGHLGLHMRQFLKNCCPKGHNFISNVVFLISVPEPNCNSQKFGHQFLSHYESECLTTYIVLASVDS